MYLNSTDPVQFEIVRTFEPRFPGNVYGPSQPVSSPGVSAQYTAPGQLANILTTFTVYPHPENPYGRETLSVYAIAGNMQTLLGAVPIMVYPKSTAKIFNALQPSAAPNPVPVASPSPYPNPSPYPLPSPPSDDEFHRRYGAVKRRNLQRLPWRHHLGHRHLAHISPGSSKQPRDGTVGPT